MRLTKTQLGKALRLLATLNCKAAVQRNKIMDHCMSVYGVEPGDINNDWFIDSCDNGCGAPSGMSAEEFDKSMRECMAHEGIKMTE